MVIFHSYVKLPEGTTFPTSNIEAADLRSPQLQILSPANPRNPWVKRRASPTAARLRRGAVAWSGRRSATHRIWPQRFSGCEKCVFFPENMEVSWNRDTPKSSIFKGFSIENHPAIGLPPCVETSIFQETDFYPWPSSHPVNIVWLVTAGTLFCSGCFELPHMGVVQNGWFSMENRIKMVFGGQLTNWSTIVSVVLETDGPRAMVLQVLSGNHNVWKPQWHSTVMFPSDPVLWAKTWIHQVMFP